MKQPLMYAVTAHRWTHQLGEPLYGWAFNSMREAHAFIHGFTALYEAERVKYMHSDSLVMRATELKNLPGPAINPPSTDALFAEWLYRHGPAWLYNEDER